MRARTIPVLPAAGDVRAGAWWAAPLGTALALVALSAYSLWAALQGVDYYVAPYLSPLYSPCLSDRCGAIGAGTELAGAWTASPAWLVLWIPIGLRATCFYYRKAYYRSFFLSPPACAVPDARAAYHGESRMPLVLQSLHRYFFYLSLPLLAFLWWDALLAFRFDGRWGAGLGSLLLLANVVLLTLFAASCNSCRHVCGGHLKSLHAAPLRHRAWRLVSRLNRHHREYAWASFATVVGADFYIRLLAAGVLHDPRLF
jgi:hypothetical protein